MRHWEILVTLSLFPLFDCLKIPDLVRVFLYFGIGWRCVVYLIVDKGQAGHFNFPLKFVPAYCTILVQFPFENQFKDNINHCFFSHIVYNHPKIILKNDNHQSHCSWSWHTGLFCHTRPMFSLWPRNSKYGHPLTNTYPFSTIDIVNHPITPPTFHQ